MEATQRPGTRTPAVAVIEAVAAASGRCVRPRRDPAGDDGQDELPPLHETIDPDALNALVDSPGAAGRSAVTVEFVYCGYDVTVDGTGQVTVTESEGASSEP